MSYYKESLFRLKKEASVSVAGLDIKTAGALAGLAVGAGGGALLAGKGNRMTGALVGGGLGAAGGYGLGAYGEHKIMNKMYGDVQKLLTPRTENNRIVAGPGDSYMRGYNPDGSEYWKTVKTGSPEAQEIQESHKYFKPRDKPIVR